MLIKTLHIVNDIAIIIIIFCHDLAKIKYPHNLQARGGVLEGGWVYPTKLHREALPQGTTP